MKILRLAAENIKRLSVVEIEPDGALVQITGKNGQGKTSVLDSIWWALAGTDPIQAQPIRSGEISAKIEVDLGDEQAELLVTRRFTAKGSTLKVAAADGAIYPSPQTMIDKLFGKLTFDPLAFMAMKPRDQFNELSGFVPDVDFAELARQEAGDVEARRDINRDAKAKATVIDGMIVPAEPPKGPVDTEALGEKLADAHQAAAVKQTWRDDCSRARDDIARVQENLEAAQKRITAFKTALDKLSDNEPPDPVNTAEIQERIRQASAINEAWWRVEEHSKLTGEHAALVEQSEAITERMNKRAAAKEAAIVAAELPVEGLGLGDGVVLYDGVPLDQASDAAQLMISTSIAAALNPDLRVIRIRSGSLLDADNLQALADFATEKDFQIWIERVADAGGVGFVMEDGHLAGVEPKPKEEKAAPNHTSKKGGGTNQRTKKAAPPKEEELF